jgi:glucose-6-phosphate isomerase
MKAQNYNLKLKTKKPEIRFLYGLRNVLYDQRWAKNAPNFELYYMERGLKKKKGLRYDITTIPPGMLGKEFVKTKGHEHLSDFGEIYIVLGGEGIYLMQKYKKGKIEDVYAVKAKKGDVVVIPPYYGHVTINPSNKTLKMANWVSEKCQSNYRPFEKMEGVCYYFTKSGWLKNKNYKNVPKLRFEKPLKRIPTDLGFLKA